MTQNTETAPTTAELAGERIAEMSASVREACGNADSDQFDLYSLAYDAIRHASPEVIGALAVELLVHKGRQAAGSQVRPPAWIQDAPSGKFPRAVPVDNKGTSTYVDFSDFSLWVLHVECVRWVGGYGRMDSADAEAYANAEADPVGKPLDAVRHLNEDHADALLAMVQALGGYPDATAAKCTGADRYGLDLQVKTPRGSAPARVGFAEPVGDDPIGLRQATVELAKRSRSILTAS